MKIFHLFIFISTIILVSCVDDIESGCTDCNATNYNSNAVNDDNSCVLLNTQKLGSYSVQDSIMSPFLDIYYDTYYIQIERDSCDSIGIIIQNYGNISNSNGPLNVSAYIDGDSLFVPYQIIEDPEQIYTTDYMTIYESKGYFKDDSLFLPIYYMNEFDPYIGNLWGKKL